MQKTGLRKRAIGGVMWSGLGQFGSYALRYAVFLILAWMLSPAAIGLESLTSVVILLAQEVGGLGFDAALIQREEPSRSYLDTSFWATLIFGFLSTGIVFLFAGDIALFLGDVRAAPLLKALSLTFPVRVLRIVPNSILLKDLAFRKLTSIQILEQVSFGIVAIVLAALGAGVWSLVIGRMVMVTMRTVMMWLMVSWRPALSFRISAFVDLIKFGSYSLASNILTRGLVRVDYFLIGRLIGTKGLGYYTLASQLAIIPAQRVVGAVHKVVYPTFSHLKSELERMKKGFLETLEHLLLILLPLSLFLVTLSPLIIELIYGDKWSPAVPLIQILSLTSLLTVFDINRAVFYATGTPRNWTLVIGARILTFILLTLGIGIQFQLSGVAVSFVLALFATTLGSIYLVSKTMSMKVGELLRCFWIPFRGVLFAILPVLGFLFIPAEAISPWVRLVGLLTTMGVMYGVNVFPAYRDSLREFFSKGYDFICRVFGLEID